MTYTKKLTRERDLKFVELWDKPSNKGFPTKDSVLITIAIDHSKTDTDLTTGGYSIKVPGDEPISRIGKTIAIRNMYIGIFDVDADQPEKHVLDFFQCRPSLHKISNEVRDRIKIICGIKEGIIGRKES